MNIGILPSVNSVELNRHAKAGDKCLFPHHKVAEQPGKEPKQSFQNGKSNDKSAAAIAKTVPQLGCISQDSEPPELPKGIGETRGEKFWDQFDGYDSQSTLRQASIRENKGPSLGKKRVKLPHQWSPYAMKFEDRSQEETEHDKTWNLARHIFASSKKRTELQKIRLPKSVLYQLRQQKNWRKESL